MFDTHRRVAADVSGIVAPLCFHNITRRRSIKARSCFPASPALPLPFTITIPFAQCVLPLFACTSANVLSDVDNLLLVLLDERYIL